MRRKTAKSLSIQLTPAQHEAVQTQASLLNLDISQYVRSLLAENVPGFHNEIPPRGTYDRRRGFVAACILDEDVVVTDQASAWMSAWHMKSGEIVPASFQLQVGDSPVQRFETLEELLEKMAQIAPFDDWIVEGEA